MANARETLVDGNRLTLLEEGQERLDALIALIDGAEKSLRILYYIYDDDGSGRRVRDALVAARQRGVRVRLIVDGFGSDVAPPGFFAPLEKAGADMCRFIPRYGRRYLLRNHQKLALADEARVIVGGFNLSDEYFGHAGDRSWRDLGLLLEGPAAARVAGYFDSLFKWAKQPRAPIRSLRRALGRWSEPDGPVRWLIGGPARRLNPWARAIRKDMKHAREIDMIAAYFAPNPAMLRRFDRVGKRGQARIVTAAKSDNLATIGAARFTYAGLLRKGVRIFEYVRMKLHTKLFVIDDAVYVGSANFDMRSLYLNLELMLRIEDKAFADRCRAYVAREREDCVEITKERLKTMGGPARHMLWALCYFVVATLDYSVTRRLNFGVDEV